MVCIVVKLYWGYPDNAKEIAPFSIDFELRRVSYLNKEFNLSPASRPLIELIIIAFSFQTARRCTRGNVRTPFRIIPMY